MKKTLKSKTLSILLCIVMTITFVPAFSVVSATTNYDRNAAGSYALNHWDDGNGACATFVSNCLQAGGLEVWNSGVSYLRSALINGGYGTEYLLTCDGGRVYQSQNVGKIDVGDPIFWYCSDCGSFYHVGIVSDINDSGLVYICAHNVAEHSYYVGGSSRWCEYEHHSTTSYVFHIENDNTSSQTTEPENQTLMTLEQLQAKFPHGKYWNHLAKSGHGYNGTTHTGNSECGDIENTWTSTPCANHTNTASVGQYDCNCYNGAIQCAGFARKLGIDAYGENYWVTADTTNVSEAISMVKPGDIIHFYGAGADSTYGHWVFVIGVTGSTVTVGECNWGAQRPLSNCLISWGRSFDLNNVSSLILYSAPYELTLTSTNSGYIYANVDSDTYYLKNSSTGAYLTADGKTDPSNLSVKTFSGEDVQQFILSGIEMPYTLSPSFDTSLRVNPFAAQNDSNVNVHTADAESNNDQHWYFEAVTGGFIIHNASNPEVVLGLDGENVRLESRTGESDQIWVLESTTPEATLVSIEINSYPSKTAYEIGESFDASGLTIRLNYSDSSTEIVSSGFTTSGFDSEDAGTKTVTVTYEGLTAIFNVEVNASSESVSLVVESVRCLPGDTDVEVALRIENNPGFFVIQLAKNFPSELEYVGADCANDYINVTDYYDETTGTFGENLVIESMKRTDTTPRRPADYTDDGEIVYLYFNVSSSTERGDYTISFNVLSANNYSLEYITDLITVTPGTISVGPMYGDVNGDKSIDTLDLTVLRQRLASTSVAVSEGADIDASGVIDSLDLTMLRKYLAGDEVTFGQSV